MKSNVELHGMTLVLWVIFQLCDVRLLFVKSKTNSFLHLESKSNYEFKNICLGYVTKEEKAFISEASNIAFSVWYLRNPFSSFKHVIFLDVNGGCISMMRRKWAFDVNYQTDFSFILILMLSCLQAM